MLLLLLLLLLLVLSVGVLSGPHRGPSGERAYAAMEPTADRLEEVAAQLIAKYTTTKAKAYALAEAVIFAMARRVNAASTFENSVGIGEGHVIMSHTAAS